MGHRQVFVSRRITARQRAGLPPGVLNLVMGPGSRLGPALASSPAPVAIGGTGTAAHGVNNAHGADEDLAGRLRADQANPDLPIHAERH